MNNKRLLKPFVIGNVMIPLTYSSKICEEKSLHFCNVLDIPKLTADCMLVKHPILNKIDQSKVDVLVDTVVSLGLSKEVLVEWPVLFSLLPNTIIYRFEVLKECGFTVTGQHLATFLHIVKKLTIKELKSEGELPPINIENQLASHMSQWPTSLTTLVQCDPNSLTLYNLRLKIIQRYLELILDLTDIEFNRALKTYPNIKHRPLGMINETLTLLQDKIGMPVDKIKSNMYLIHADAENLKQLIYNIRSIAGIDIKLILQRNPKICVCNWRNTAEIKEIFEEYNISTEAQKRCLHIFTLSAATIKNRLEYIKNTPEFSIYLNHPRGLKLIYYHKNAAKRIIELSFMCEKKCMTLNSLSGCTRDYDKFMKSPGDRIGKGRDLFFCLSEQFGTDTRYLRKIIKRHPFWINIPIINITLVLKKLSKKYSQNDIYNNCSILLYPLNAINHTLRMLQTNNTKELSKLIPFFDQVDILQLTNTQVLSLALYIIEKNHYFSGNGVWTDAKLLENNQFTSDKNHFSKSNVL